MPAIGEPAICEVRGFVTIALFLVAVLSRRVSVLIALPILVAVVTGFGGDLDTPRPDSLKVNFGYLAESKVETEISYAGPNKARRTHRDDRNRVDTHPV